MARHALRRRPLRPRVCRARRASVWSSAAARSFAHIGVIQALEADGIRVDLVAGTSADSLVAALYASGKTPAELGVPTEAVDETALTDLPGVSGADFAARGRSMQAGRDALLAALPALRARTAAKTR